MALATVVFNRLPLVGGYTSGPFKSIYDLGDGKYEHGGEDELVAQGPTQGALIVNPDAVDGRAKVHEIITPANGDYGIHVKLDHQGTAEWSLYAHMSRVHPDLRVGQVLPSGAPLGYAGATGLATGPHLHWEVVSNASAPSFGALRTAPDASGVRRLIPGITLRNPQDYLQKVTGPIVPSNTVTIEDVAKSLGNLNRVVIEIRDRPQMDPRAIAREVADLIIEKLRQ